MKTVHRIVTGQFEYVEVEDTFPFEHAIPPEEIRKRNDELKAAFQEKPESTLPEKEMVDFLYAQIHALGNHVETWELMNPGQKAFVNQLKKALARKKPNDGHKLDSGRD